MVDLTRGRKQVVDTKGKSQEADFVTYYSPNAIKNMLLQLDDSPCDGNPFHPECDSVRPTWEDFRKPRPWSLAFGWISFIPSLPVYKNASTPPFDILVHSPPIVEFTDEQGDVKGFGLRDTSRWATLEQHLYDAVVALKAHYHIPIVLPFLPRAFGYDKIFRSKGTLKFKIGLSREWFLVWVGALSYCIAWTRSPSDPHEAHAAKKYPQWRAVLEGRGLRPDWLDDVENSVIGQFSAYYSRAGTVLDVLNPQPRQPTPEWLVKHGITVWYRWDKDELQKADEDQVFAKYGPPTAAPWMQFAIASSSASTQATTSAAPSAAMTVAEATCSEGGTAGTQTIVVSSPEAMRESWRTEFFKKRNEEHQTLMQKETPESKQRRLNRAREPATASAKVFEWFPDEDNCSYKRLPVNAKARLDTLWSYGEKQRIYDPFYNEWNCCSDFGDDDDDVVDAHVASTTTEASPIQTDHALPPSTTVHLKPATTATPQATTTLSQGDNLSDDPHVALRAALLSGLGRQVLETFSKHYGLCQPIPDNVPPAATTFSDREVSLFLRVATKGEASSYVELFKKSPEYWNTLSFFAAFLRGGTPAPGTWDLRDDCIHPLRLTERFKSVMKRPILCFDQELKDSYRNTNVYYVFERSTSPVPWKFATLTAGTAAIACRLPKDLSEEDVAFYFAQRGIPFRIFYPRKLLPPLPPQIPLPYARPVRQYDHHFTPDDYDGYVRQRTLLLGQSHMHAAIKRGGIIWRLAVPVLGLHDVCRPPTRWGSYSRPVLQDGEHCDDLLTNVEMDMICGVYECTDDAGQTKLLSWWPLPRYYEKEENGENYEFWTLNRETWFEARLNDIENHGAQPLSYSDWKQQLHGQVAIRKFHKTIESSSQALFIS